MLATLGDLWAGRSSIVSRACAAYRLELIICSIRMHLRSSSRYCLERRSTDWWMATQQLITPCCNWGAASDPRGVSCRQQVAEHVGLLPGCSCHSNFYSGEMEGFRKAAANRGRSLTFWGRLMKQQWLWLADPTWKKLTATEDSASRGHSLNQSMVQPLMSAGNMRSRCLQDTHSVVRAKRLEVSKTSLLLSSTKLCLVWAQRCELT